jgi:D-alanine transaminase
VLYAQKAERDGVYETILYREGGRVTECSHSNVHIITNDGVFKTAPTDNLILPGIARANLIKMCKKLGIPVVEEEFTLERLMNADEIIVSSSGSFCLSATHIDGIAVGGRAPELLAALRRELIADFENSTEA